MRNRIQLIESVLIVFIGVWSLSAQTPKPSPTPECSLPVYTGKEVDRKVKVLDYPAPHFDSYEMATYSSAVVILRAIFCGDGKVTDIKVQRHVSQSLDDEAIRTAKTIRFQPAEKEGKRVSQWMTLEYHIND
ncbi:MAG TPA: energy transducer TonB [Pyrinomonadaceae bacterium]|jgi:TonB family protein|nr:energy transducer TonB [Pyrinomonadaceae bacterium]